MWDLKFYQLAVAAISVLMIFFGLEKFWRHAPQQSWFKLGARLIIWGGMAAIAIFPQLSNYLARWIGLEGNINAVILIGFILIFLFIFKILSVVERIEYEISELTRQWALKNFKDQDRKQ